MPATSLEPRRRRATTARHVMADLAAVASPAKARVLAGFFKTAPGMYGAGDVFLGVPVPIQNRIAKRFADLPERGLAVLLRSRIHEHRAVALTILVHQYASGDEATKRARFRFYTSNLAAVNNWDLVDASAAKIVGTHLLSRDRRLLRRLARSADVWERRIAIVATFAFICAGESRDTMEIAEALLHDEHDLIHKATGWMLREVGKRVSVRDLRGFLAKHSEHLPRTALRYAIEHFDHAERARWLRSRLSRP